MTRIIRKRKFTVGLAKFLVEKKVRFFVNVFPGVAAVTSQTPYQEQIQRQKTTETYRENKCNKEKLQNKN